MDSDDDNHQNNLIKHEELMEYPKNLDKLNKWTIPSVPSNQIYKFGKIDLLSRFAVKSLEQTIQISESTQTIKLLTKKDLLPFKNYNYIHVGLIQIVVKPLTLLGLNASILGYIRDGRCKDFKQSLAALIETSLCHGPVYFDVSPNISLSMSDKNLLDALQLTIHTNGYNFKSGSEIMAICYRVYYKVLTTLNPKARHISFPGTTTLVQTNLLTSNVATNRLLKWDEINFPETWNLPQALEPEPVLNKEVDQIIQSNEGDLEINFSSKRMIRIPRSMSGRHSVNSINEFYSAPSQLSRPSTSQLREEIEVVENIRLSENKIPHGIYQKPKVESPTPSDMDFPL